MKLRHPLAVATAAALAALPASAGAAQTSSLTYQCKYPLIGVKKLQLNISVGIPNTLAIEQPTDQFEVFVEASAYDMAAGLAAVDDLTSVQGTSTAFATVHAADGSTIPATTEAVIPETVLPDPIPQPLRLAATGLTPSITVGARGVATVTLDRLAINLTALDSVGDPIVLPPVTRDIDGNKVSDSDADPNTFDVYCKLDPADQDTTIASAEFSGDPIEPTPSPSPYNGPTPPTPSPTMPPPTGSPLPSTPTPSPSPVRTPPPTPTPTPSIDIPAGASTAPFQCKWPLVGIQPAEFSAVFRPEVGPHSTRTLRIWMRSVQPASLSVVSDFERLGGALNVTFEQQGYTFSPQAPVFQYRERTLPDGEVETLLYSEVAVMPTDLFWGTEPPKVTAAAPNLVALDASGTPVPLPPVTKDIDGNPFSDSDGDPNTFNVSCKPDPTAATPTPPPTVTPTPTSTPGLPSARYAYALKGSTTLNTLTKGTMPLTGGVDARLVLSTGDVTADLTLNDTQGRLTALGFLPVTVTVGFVPSGQTTGKLVDDQLETHSKVRIKVRSVKAFGAIPLAGGNSCQSKQLSDITLKSTDSFDPTGAGGSLGGTYAISDLNGCGVLNGLVSPLTAGAGNTIAVKLTPQP